MLVPLLPDQEGRGGEAVSEQWYATTLGPHRGDVTLTPTGSADRLNALEKENADLRARLAAAEERIARYLESVIEWQAAATAAEARVRELEAERNRAWDRVLIMLCGPAPSSTCIICGCPASQHAAYTAGCRSCWKDCGDLFHSRLAQAVTALEGAKEDFREVQRTANADYDSVADLSQDEYNHAVNAVRRIDAALTTAAAPASPLSEGWYCDCHDPPVLISEHVTTAAPACNGHGTGYLYDGQGQIVAEYCPTCRELRWRTAAPTSEEKHGPDL